MATKCANCPLRALDLFKNFTPEEAEFMERFKTGEMVVGPGTTLLIEGSKSPQLFTALEGMGLRYKTLESGRRQVINFVFPGDFIGLQAGILGEMSHSVEATTAMTLCVFNRSDIWSLFKSQPNRAFDLTWLASASEHFLSDALATVGQRPAMERIAWAMTTIRQRIMGLRMSDGSTVKFPYRQQDLADALGLSLVHTNKTLAKFRERGILTWVNGRIEFHDVDALTRLLGPDDPSLGQRHLM